MSAKEHLNALAELERASGTILSRLNGILAEVRGPLPSSDGDAQLRASSSGFFPEAEQRVEDIRQNLGRISVALNELDQLFGEGGKETRLETPRVQRPVSATKVMPSIERDLAEFSAKLNGGDRVRGTVEGEARG